MMMKYRLNILRLLGAELHTNTQVKILGNISNKVIMLAFNDKINALDSLENNFGLDIEEPNNYIIHLKKQQELEFLMS